MNGSTEPGEGCIAEEDKEGNGSTSEGSFHHS